MDEQLVVNRKFDIRQPVIPVPAPGDGLRLITTSGITPEGTVGLHVARSDGSVSVFCYDPEDAISVANNLLGTAKLAQDAKRKGEAK